MSKLTALIIDDELQCRENLKILIQEYCPDVQIVDTADSVDAAVSTIEQHRPDLLFLDVQMPGGNGFSLFKQVAPKDFITIFVTAHDQYALQAIKASACDYLLKPIDIQELEAAVERAFWQFENIHSKQNFDQESFAYLLECLEQQKRPEKISIQHSNKITLVAIADLVLLQADNSYTTFFLADGREIVVAKTMKAYEMLLDEKTFIKVHRSYIVNTRHIQEFSYDSGGQLTMNNGISVPVSKRKLPEVVQRLKHI